MDKENRASIAIEALLERREEARKEGDYELADRIRKSLLEELRIHVRDTRNGPRWTVRARIKQ